MKPKPPGYPRKPPGITTTSVITVIWLNPIIVLPESRQRDLCTAPNSVLINDISEFFSAIIFMRGCLHDTHKHTQTHTHATNPHPKIHLNQHCIISDGGVRGFAAFLKIQHKRWMSGIRRVKLHYTFVYAHALSSLTDSFFFFFFFLLLLFNLHPPSPISMCPLGFSQQSRLIVLNSVLCEAGHVPDKHVD